MKASQHLRQAATLVNIACLEAEASGNEPPPWLIDLRDSLRILASTADDAEASRVRSAAVEAADREAERSAIRSARMLSSIALNDSSHEIETGGCWVYLLLAHDGRVLYVGESTNILSRLGQHMVNPDRRDMIATVRLILCKDERTMHEVEGRLIAELRPPLNVIGVR